MVAPAFSGGGSPHPLWGLFYGPVRTKYFSKTVYHTVSLYHIVVSAPSKDNLSPSPS